ncbi:pPIWI-associating nuclease domain-containing protein [Ewingella americana]
MKLKKLQSLDFIIRFERHLDSSFEKELYISSLRNYSSHGNPLRFHNFAFVMRELITYIINKKAPVDKVKEAPWYVRGDSFREVTRKQQLKYCMQMKISDEYLGAEFLQENSESLKLMEKNYIFLNKFTHINEDHLSPSPQEFFEKAKSIIQTATEILEAIEECRDEVIDKLRNKISDAVQDTAESSIPDGLSILANNAYINYTQVDEYGIDSIDDEHIYIYASGYVNVTQEYGPSNDGTSLEEEYPFTLAMRSRLDSPEAFDVLSDSLNVDTSSWYGVSDEDEDEDEEILVTSENIPSQQASPHLAPEIFDDSPPF